MLSQAQPMPFSSSYALSPAVQNRRNAPAATNQLSGNPSAAANSPGPLPPTKDANTTAAKNGGNGAMS